MQVLTEKLVFLGLGNRGNWSFSQKSLEESKQLTTKGFLGDIRYITRKT